MIRLRLLAATGLCCLGLIGPVHSEPRTVGPAADTKAIEDVQKRWIEAYRSQNIDALVALYTQDAVLMNKDQPLLRGQEAIRARFAAMMARVDLQMRDETEEIEVRGGEAHAIGLFHIVGRPRAGGPEFQSAGRYFILFRRGADGSWRVYRDMDSPTPDAARLAEQL